MLMLFSAVSLALLLPFVSAIAFFIPGEATAGGPLTISWSDRSRDDPRSVSIKLANPDLPGSRTFDLASNVDISEPGERSVTLPRQIQSDERYVVQFFAANDLNTVLGSVGPLSVSGGSGGPPSSTQSTSSTSSSSASSASRSTTTASSTTTGSAPTSNTSGATSTSSTSPPSTTSLTSLTAILTRTGSLLGTTSETGSTTSGVPTITVSSITVATDLPATPSSAATPLRFCFGGGWIVGGALTMLGLIVI